MLFPISPESVLHFAGKEVGKRWSEDDLLKNEISSVSAHQYSSNDPDLFTNVPSPKEKENTHVLSATTCFLHHFLSPVSCTYRFLQFFVV